MSECVSACACVCVFVPHTVCDYNVQKSDLDVRVCVCIYECVSVHVCVCVCARVRVHVCVCVCVFSPVYI